MKVSLVISTYNSVDFLNLCLKSTLKLIYMPDEIIVADDGSDEKTAELVDKFRKLSSVPIVHVWHEDRGFRLAEIRNKAFGVAKYDYIISIDGDMILDANFVKDHLRHAAPMTYLQGTRAMISSELTSVLVRNQDIKFNTKGDNVKHRFKSVRVPYLLSRIVSMAFQGRYPRDYAKGANMSFNKVDLERVNGFDSDFVGWGCEDNDLAVRLQNSGVKRRVVRQACVLYHLDHGDGHRISDSQNLPKLKEHIRTRATWCKNGIKESLDKY